MNKINNKFICHTIYCLKCIILYFVTLKIFPFYLNNIQIYNNINFMKIYTSRSKTNKSGMLFNLIFLFISNIAFILIGYFFSWLYRYSKINVWIFYKKKIRFIQTLINDY